MALVVGHSQVKYLETYFSDNRIDTLWFPECEIKDLLRHCSIIERIPTISVLALMVGAHDMDIHSAETMLEQLQHTCMEVHKLNASAQILVVDILPRDDDRFPGCNIDIDYLEFYNNKAAMLNSGMSDFASTMPWLECVHVSPAFYDDRGRVNCDLLSTDGLYLSPNGTSTVANDIQGSVVAILNDEQTGENFDELAHGLVSGRNLRNLRIYPGFLLFANTTADLRINFPICGF